MIGRMVFCANQYKFSESSGVERLVLTTAIEITQNHKTLSNILLLLIYQTLLFRDKDRKDARQIQHVNPYNDFNSMNNLC